MTPWLRTPEIVVTRRFRLCTVLAASAIMGCARQPPRLSTSDRGLRPDVPAPINPQTTNQYDAAAESVVVVIPRSQLPACEWSGLGRQTPLPTELRPLRCGPVEWFVGGCTMHCTGREAWRAPGQRCMDPCGIWLHHTGRSCWMGISAHPGQINLRIQDGRVKIAGLSRSGDQISIDEEFQCRTGYPFEGAEVSR